ncbi:hypothetical protein [Amycolatopsis methanolica]|uniref:Uncharacterized protein n=1 Tax=Amycolatopsis methanolica 239 TaxID=1068978 RepID=A0A076MNI3_AMYME|nr:hypothetical protein [Amycolatopsis methanolica]AIJ20430.1 hypothetical protein AMETH_0338 [Amycolatopsis methanolica 239]
MTTSKSETPDTGGQDDPNAELAELTRETPGSDIPAGVYDPNTPPPTGVYDPNTPPTGVYDPNTPPPTGVYDPNTPPPSGVYDPNTPPNGNGTPVQPAPRAQGVWVHGRQVARLWSTSANPGVWVDIAGLGWKRLAATADGRSSLTTLALLARNHGLPVSFHENAAGQIDQILV